MAGLGAGIGGFLTGLTDGIKTRRQWDDARADRDRQAQRDKADDDRNAFDQKYRSDALDLQRQRDARDADIDAQNLEASRFALKEKQDATAREAKDRDFFSGAQSAADASYDADVGKTIFSDHSPIGPNRPGFRVGDNEGPTYATRDAAIGVAKDRYTPAQHYVDTQGPRVRAFLMSKGDANAATAWDTFVNSQNTQTQLNKAAEAYARAQAGDFEGALDLVGQIANDKTYTGGDHQHGFELSRDAAGNVTGAVGWRRDPATGQIERHVVDSPQALFNEVLPYLDPAAQFKSQVDTFRAGKAGNTEGAKVKERQAVAASVGLDQTDPAFKTYVLTGKMPTTGKGAAAGSRPPLTATDKKAILDADDTVAASQGAIDALDQAIALSPKAYDGFGAKDRAAVASNMPGAWDGSAETLELDNLVTSNALGQLKAIFGAAPTEGERKILLEIQGSVNQTRTVRERIYARAKELASRRLKINQRRALELRSGDFYNPDAGAVGDDPGNAALPPDQDSGPAPEPDRQNTQNWGPASTDRSPPPPTGPATSPPSAAIDFLRANPNLASQFDAKYGAGSAASILGGR